MIFVLEYQTRRTTFSNNIFSFIHFHQILFSKNVPYFCRLSTDIFFCDVKKIRHIFTNMNKSKDDVTKSCSTSLIF